MSRTEIPRTFTGVAWARSKAAGTRIRSDCTCSQLTEELETRKVVERAKGILQRGSRLSEEEAYLALRRQSRQQRKSMKEVAEAVVAAESRRQQARPS